MGRKQKQRPEPPEDSWTTGTWSADTGNSLTGPPSTGATSPGVTNTWTAESSTTSINPWLVVGFATSIFVVAVAALVVVFTNNRPEQELVVDTSTTTTTGPPSTTSAPPPTVTTQVSIAPPTVPPIVPPTVPPTVPVTTSPYMSEADALYAIQSDVDADRGSVEELTGWWVPQISSKKIGLDVRNDDRGAYTAAMVLSDHIGYEERYEPQGYDVRMLRSDDYNFKESGWIVTVVAQPFLTAEEANGWCDAQNIGVDDCFAKRLTHDGDWKGSVLGRK